MKTKRSLRKLLAHLANDGEYQPEEASIAVARGWFLIACVTVEPAIGKSFAPIHDAWPRPSAESQLSVSLSRKRARKLLLQNGILDAPDLDDLAAKKLLDTSSRNQMPELKWADLKKLTDHAGYSALAREVGAWQARWHLTAPWCADWALEVSRNGPPFEIFVPIDDGFQSPAAAPPAWYPAAENHCAYIKRLKAWMKTLDDRTVRDNIAKKHGLVPILDAREIEHFYWLAGHQVGGLPAALIADAVDKRKDPRRTVQMALVKVRKLIDLPERPEPPPLRGRARDDKIRLFRERVKSQRELRRSLRKDSSGKRGPVHDLTGLESSRTENLEIPGL